MGLHEIQRFSSFPYHFNQLSFHLTTNAQFTTNTTTTTTSSVVGRGLVSADIVVLLRESSNLVN